MAKQDWEKIWAEQELDLGTDRERLAGETRTPRWQRMTALIRERLGSLDQIRTIELGAGFGDYSLLLRQNGAQTTLADYSPQAITKAESRFAVHGLDADFVLADVLEAPRELEDAFDVSFSLGVAEHFEGAPRQGIVSADARVLRPGGLTFISVPYRFSPTYRVWKRGLEKAGNWSYGLEVPFTRREIARLGEAAGLETVGFIQSSFFTDWDTFFPKHRVQKVFDRWMYRPTVFDRMGYALTYVGQRANTSR